MSRSSPRSTRCQPDAAGSRDNRPLTQLFGFVQLDFAGRLAVADGRYVLRDGGNEQVLVLETLGAPPPPRRRRRRARKADRYEEPSSLPLTRVTLVRAFAPFGAEDEAAAWLERTSGSEEPVDAAIAESIGVLNRVLHVQAVAQGAPLSQTLDRKAAVSVRLGYGRGEEVADGEFTEARDVGDGVGGRAPHRRRSDELRPQQRLAAVLGGRERLDACETLLLRARADLEAGRNREAALQLRVGLEALLAELADTRVDADHKRDMATLRDRRQEAGEDANAALMGDLGEAQAEDVRDLVELSERVLRRRRILSG